MPQETKANLFISYAHENRDFIPELRKYLNEKFCPQIDFWIDEKLEGGQEWHSSILKNLQNADIVLLLISQEFLVSTYIETNELKIALLKHDEEKCHVIPIFIDYSNVKKFPEITKLQGYPNPDTPLLAVKEGKSKKFIEIQEAINSIAEGLVKNKNVKRILKEESSSPQFINAQKIDQLKNLTNIFLSIPVSDAGNDMRKDFLIEVDGYIKYDNPKWPYKMVPEFKEARELFKSLKENHEQIQSKLQSEFIYSILIIASAEDLAILLSSGQYELAKYTNSDSQNCTMLWLLNEEVKAELDKLEEALKLELKMIPSIVGKDLKKIFSQIDAFDKAKLEKINKLTTQFSPMSKICIFYDDKDDDNELRIALRSQLQDDKNITLREISGEDKEKEKTTIEKCNGAIIFYGPNSNTKWYKARQDIIVDAENIKVKAVCLDVSQIEIERMIKKVILKNEVETIITENELREKVNTIKFKLQTS